MREIRWLGHPSNKLLQARTTDEWENYWAKVWGTKYLHSLKVFTKCLSVAKGKIEQWRNPVDITLSKCSRSAWPVRKHIDVYLLIWRRTWYYLYDILAPCPWPKIKNLNLIMRKNHEGSLLFKSVKVMNSKEGQRNLSKTRGNQETWPWNAVWDSVRSWTRGLILMGKLVKF